ncbi:MAG: type I restriction endonuclease subunit R [Anaerolineales bacterium]|nr:type I restriction endonuclease subunit R [Anaerolineales bacterium]
MPPSNYLEQDFEEHIEQQLLQSGYLQRSPTDYDRELCLIPDELLHFLQQSQPEELERLQRHYGNDLQQKLCDRLASVIQKRGTLDVLRKGFKDHGAKVHLAYFKPSSGMNPEHRKLYQANRFAVVRQLKYSKRNENSIDLVLFLNGVPIITAELKNSLTGQFVDNAIHQYKHDRDPRGEPLLAFRRCLVHFAVGNEKAFMTTRLQGKQTRFLPFNKDTENPENPNGHKTAYLWEDIWQPDTLLELIRNYLHVQVNTEKRYDHQKGLVEVENEIFIFPRFHQLDVVRKLLAAVRADGVGKNYLVQHSAGSGKSNSIAWLAHQLATFYQNPQDKERLFDSIIVVTDRRVLDRQLQNTIKQFEQVQGVVKKIEKDSAQLQEALETGKAIIVTTLQKFPVISESITRLKGKRFAVFIDEAHSSQSGESAKHLKKTLSVNLDQAENEDRTGIDLEDTILEEIHTRGPQNHISYFAFTATPKNKTIELFGTPGPDGTPAAFHTYSMRQAIEESFILDVLKNYTTFKRYFKLVKTIKDDKEYEKKKAVQLLTSYVDLQPHAIETKARIMLEHFLDKTVHTIQGQGRAMVVTRSRLHAVRFYLMFRKIMAEKQLGYKPLVAFSGTVKDPVSGAEYTEKSLNRLAPRVAIPDAFKTPEYRILIVANKFQTGFDEPLLHTMYVDKRLDGVQAVQALSRLNRNPKGKEDPFVLDFVNEAETIQKAFQPYYQVTMLEEKTDPNRLYDLETELQAFEIYTDQDVDDFAAVFFASSEPMEKLQPILDRVVLLWGYKPENEREDFRSTLQRFIRLYGFVSQIITFEDVDLEKLYVFARALNRKLPRRWQRLPFEIKDAVDLDSFRIQQTYSGSIALEQENGTVPGYGNGATMMLDPEMDLLSNIIQVLNDTYGLNLSEEDRIDIQVIKNKLEADEELLAVILADNPPDTMRYKFNQVVDQILLEFVHTKLDLYKKLTNPKVNELFKDKWFEGYMEQVKSAS